MGPKKLNDPSIPYYDVVSSLLLPLVDPETGLMGKNTVEEMTNQIVAALNPSPFRGEWGDYANLPVDADAVGSGTDGVLQYGDEFYITADANYDAGLGDGAQDFNAYAILKYLGDGKWKITQ